MFTLQVKKVTIGDITACVIAGRKKTKYIWQFEKLEIVFDAHFEDEGKGSSEEVTLIFQDVGSDDDADLSDIEVDVKFKKSISDVRSGSVLKKILKTTQTSTIKEYIQEFAQRFKNEK